MELISQEVFNVGPKEAVPAIALPVNLLVLVSVVLCIVVFTIPHICLWLTGYRGFAWEDGDYGGSPRFGIKGALSRDWRKNENS